MSASRLDKWADRVAMVFCAGCLLISMVLWWSHSHLPAHPHMSREAMDLERRIDAVENAILKMNMEGHRHE